MLPLSFVELHPENSHKIRGENQSSSICSVLAMDECSVFYADRMLQIRPLWFSPLFLNDCISGCELTNAMW